MHVGKQFAPKLFKIVVGMKRVKNSQGIRNVYKLYGMNNVLISMLQKCHKFTLRGVLWVGFS